jgi:hypothetical protein
MKKTQYIVTELSLQEIIDLVAESYGGGETEDTKIVFNILKDVSDQGDRFPIYKLNGATVTVSKEVK